jgi:cellulose synthase/poly-beta-1,6-N-acetylglucosamine synthase-like glycosyltransferase
MYDAGAKVPLTRVSVIVPARNEEANIERLVVSLGKQEYPKELLEVIVVDDHSTDRTAEIVRQYEWVKLVQLKDDAINSYKKKAIETGIAAASGTLIVTTDADCFCPENWLRTIVSFYEESKSVFVAAPVAIDCSAALVQFFQAYDFAVLQGITAASVYKNIHSMSNGANQAYERAAFYEVNGFSGIDNIASGDDMLLMHKIWKKYPTRVQYLKSKDAIVHTEPVTTWQAFFKQRIRWASKATYYNDKRITAVLALVYLFNLSFPVLLIAGCWNSSYWLYVLVLWIMKTLVELPFVYSVSAFFNKQYLTRFFFLLQPLHIFYTVISGLFGQFGKYEWKGRTVK